MPKENKGLKTVTAFSPGYGACPQIPDIPPYGFIPLLRPWSLFSDNRACVTAGQCSKMSSLILIPVPPLFHSPTSGLTWTDRLSIMSLQHCLSTSPGATQVCMLLGIISCLSLFFGSSFRSFLLLYCAFLFWILHVYSASLLCTPQSQVLLRNTLKWSTRTLLLCKGHSLYFLTYVF